MSTWSVLRTAGTSAGKTGELESDQQQCCYQDEIWRVPAKRGMLPWSSLEECVRPRLFDLDLFRSCYKKLHFRSFLGQRHSQSEVLEKHIFEAQGLIRAPCRPFGKTFVLRLKVEVKTQKLYFKISSIFVWMYYSWCLHTQDFANGFHFRRKFHIWCQLTWIFLKITHLRWSRGFTQKHPQKEDRGECWAAFSLKKT